MSWINDLHGRLYGEEPLSPASFEYTRYEYKRPQAVPSKSHLIENLGFGQLQLQLRDVGQRHQQDLTALKSDVEPVESCLSTQDFGVHNHENEAINGSIPTNLEVSNGKMSPCGDSRSVDMSNNEPINIFRQPPEPMLHVGEKFPDSQTNGHINEQVLELGDMSPCGVSTKTVEDFVQPAIPPDSQLEKFVSLMEGSTESAVIESTAVEPTADDQSRETNSENAPLSSSITTERPESSIQPTDHRLEPVPDHSLLLVESQNRIIEAPNDTSILPVIALDSFSPPLDQFDPVPVSSLLLAESESQILEALNDTSSVPVIEPDSSLPLSDYQLEPVAEPFLLPVENQDPMLGALNDTSSVLDMELDSSLPPTDHQLELVPGPFVLPIESQDQIIEDPDDYSSLPVLAVDKFSPMFQSDQANATFTETQKHRMGSSVDSHHSDPNYKPDEWDILSEIADLKTNVSHGRHSPPSTTRGAGPGPGPGPSVKINHPQNLMVEDQSRNLPLREKDWEKVKRLRVEVWSLRSKIHEMRSVLRKKQLFKSDADDNFLQFVRRQATRNNSFGTLDEQKTLETLLGDCEIARNEYGPLEDDLNLLESDLGNQEYVLQKLESKVYDRPIILPVPQLEEFNLGLVQAPNSSGYSDSESSQQFHPLVTEYLSKMGDVDIYRERLDWHWDEKETLDEEKEKRLRVGLDLALPDQEWLDNYSETESELQSQLAQAEEEADKLRLECFSRGLIDEEGSPTDFENRERQTFLMENVDSRNEISEYVKFPTLIPPPNGKQIAFGESSPDDEPNMDDSSAINPRYRVDKWMLHQLRMSVLGVKLLADTFEIQTGDTIKDEGRWQEDVLAKWFSDSSDEWDKGPQTDSSGLSTQAPPPLVEYPLRLTSNEDRDSSYKFPFGHPTAKSTSSLGFQDTAPTPYPAPTTKTISSVP